MLWIILGLVWLLFALLTYAMLFAHDQREYPAIADEWRIDMGVAILFALLTPVSTVVIFCLTGFAKHGLLWWPEARHHDSER